MYTKQDIPALVQTGIDTLNAHFAGTIWVRHIDVSRLDIWSVVNCVLGQLFGSYAKGLAELGLDSGIDHGFTDIGFTTTEHLTAEWRKRIAATCVAASQ